MMSEPPRTCPRCWHPALPAMVRCQSCGQILSRPGALPSSAMAARALVRVAVQSQPAHERERPIPAASTAERPTKTPEFESDTKTAVLDRGTPLPGSSEKLRVVCHCGAAIRVSIVLRGKRIKCPKCSELVPVPTTRPHEHTNPKPDTSAAEDTAAESMATRNNESGERQLKDEIELAANCPATPDDETTSRRGMSSFRFRKLRKLLETANVLSDADTIARRHALMELGQSQDRRVLEILVEHTRDSSSIIRDGAITALGDFDDPQAVPAVLRALLDRNADVVRAAFTALKKIGDRRVVRPLLRFGHERPEWRPLANDTLVRLGPRVVQELLNILQTNDAGLTLDAIVVLGRIGDKQAVSALIACMNHVSNLLKAHVTEALALIGDSRAVPQLLRALEDPHAPTRANAAAGLVRMADPRSLRPLLKALQDDDGDVRGYAATALGELGEAKAVPELAGVLAHWETLEHEDAQFLEAVVESLGKLGDTTAVAALIPLLQSQQDGVLLKTVLALKKLRDPSAAQALIALLHVPKPTVRRRVMETLGQTGDVALVPLIGESLRHDDSLEVRAAAAHALGELKDRTACPFLEDALRDNISIRCQAVIALGAIHEKSTLAALMAMLKEAAPEVRYHAVNAVAKFKDPKTLKAVAALLEDSDPMVRNGAAKVIEEFGQAVEDKGVKEILRRVRSRDLLGRLIPKWVYFVLPQSKAARGTVAAVLAASLLLGFIIKTTIGGPNKVLVRGNVQSLALSADGGTLVAERTLGMLEVWDVNGQRVSQQVGLENLRTPLFRAKGGVVLMSGESVVPWKLSGNPDLAAGWKEHKQPILNACVTPDGKFAATLGKDLIAVVWDLEAGKKRATVELDERFAATLTISPDGQRLATSNRKGEVVLWEVESGRRAKELSGAKIPKAISALAISPDGNWLVGVEVSGGLRVWDLTAPAGSPVEKSFASRTPLRAVALRFLSDSKRTVMADAGGEVRVWDIGSGESHTVCTGDIDQIDGFALSADEKRFAIGGNGNSVVLVYDLESGELFKKLDVRR